MSHSRFAWVICLLLLTFASVAEAQGPEIYYFKFNEVGTQQPRDDATPGLGGIPTRAGAAKWEGLNSRIGNSCLRPGPGAADRVNTNATFTVAAGSWTLECWIYNNLPNSDMTDNYLCGDPVSQNWRIHRGAPSAPGDLIWQHNGLSATFVGADQQNTWVHIALVHDSAALTLTTYVNGTAGTPTNVGAPVVWTGSLPVGLSIGGYASSPAWNGFIDEFRFWSQARTAPDILLNLNTEFGAPIDDAAVLGITSPDDSNLGCNNFTAAEPVTAVFRNTGLNQIAMGAPIPVFYTVNNGAPIGENAFAPTNLNPNDSFTHTFSTPANLSVAGTYTIDVAVALPGDSVSTNDTQTTELLGGGLLRITQFPHVEEFSNLPSMVNPNTTPPLGWEQDQNDATGTGAFPDWVFTNTQSAPPTGPLSDHTTGVSGQGFYAYVSDLGNHPEVNLLTPCLDFGALSTPAMGFYYWSGNIAQPNFENFLHVDVIPFPSQVPVLDVTPAIGHVGAAWNFLSIDLTAFAGQVVQIRFRGESDGGALTHDLAIDDLLFFQSAPTNGQGPQLGAGTFDINGAVNGAGAAVSSGANGPYFGSTKLGGQTVMTFEGEPNQPVIILFGPLNPGLFSLPGTGSLDIGTGIDIATGFPLGVSLLINGAIPSGLNLFFNTGPTGSGLASFPVPNLPLGVLSVFQAMVLNSVSPVNFVFTNAIELTIVP